MDHEPTLIMLGEMAALLIRRVGRQRFNGLMVEAMRPASLARLPLRPPWPLPAP
jgi:hypothetical protein